MSGVCERSAVVSYGGGEKLYLECHAVLAVFERIARDDVLGNAIKLLRDER